MSALGDELRKVLAEMGRRSRWALEKQTRVDPEGEGKEKMTGFDEFLIGAVAVVAGTDAFVTIRLSRRVQLEIDLLMLQLQMMNGMPREGPIKPEAWFSPLGSAGRSGRAAANPYEPGNGKEGYL